MRHRAGTVTAHAATRRGAAKIVLGRRSRGHTNHTIVRIDDDSGQSGPAVPEYSTGFGPTAEFCLVTRPRNSFSPGPEQQFPRTRGKVNRLWSPASHRIAAPSPMARLVWSGSNGPAPRVRPLLSGSYRPGRAHPPSGGYTMRADYLLLKNDRFRRLPRQ